MVSNKPEITCGFFVRTFFFRNSLFWICQCPRRLFIPGNGLWREGLSGFLPGVGGRRCRNLVWHRGSMGHNG